MTPECCKNCEYHTEEYDCTSVGKNCPRWRAWFRKEWRNIQKAAAVEKKNDKKEDPPE